MAIYGQYTDAHPSTIALIIHVFSNKPSVVTQRSVVAQPLCSPFSLSCSLHCFCQLHVPACPVFTSTESPESWYNLRNFS